MVCFLPLPLGDVGKPGLYEPVHGSAPDIAGQNKANPLATILSFSMALRYSLSRGDLADMIECAVQAVLNAKIRTADIMADGCILASTSAMGDADKRAGQRAGKGRLKILKGDKKEKTPENLQGFFLVLGERIYISSEHAE